MILVENCQKKEKKKKLRGNLTIFFRWYYIKGFNSEIAWEIKFYNLADVEF